MSPTAASRSPATAPRTACGSSSDEDRQPSPRSLLLLASGTVTEFLHVGGRQPARLQVGLRNLPRSFSAFAFLGIASRWQLFAGIPAALASVSICPVAQALPIAGRA